MNRSLCKNWNLSGWVTRYVVNILYVAHVILLRIWVENFVTFVWRGWAIVNWISVKVSREKLVYDRREDYGPFFWYKPSFRGRNQLCQTRGQRWSEDYSLVLGGGVGRGERGATFLKAAGGIKALQIHFARVSLASAYSKQFSHSFRECKAGKNGRKRRIRDSKAWFGKGLLFAGELREKNYRVPVQTERGRGHEGVGTDVRNIQDGGLCIILT